MNKCYLLLLVCFGGLVVSGLTSCAPAGTLQQAEIYDKNEQYYDAVVIYKSLYKSEKKDRHKKAEFAFRLGEDLRKNRDYRQSEGWYQRAISLNYKDPGVYQRLADVLKMDEKYEDAIVALENYKKEMPSDTAKASEQISVIKEYLTDKPSCQLYFVDNFRVANSPQNDYAPVMVKGLGLVFTSDRPDATGKKTFGRTGLKYSDLFVITKKKSGKVDKWTAPATPLPGDVNTGMNQGTATFDAKGNTMYYTDCNGPLVIDVKKKNDAKNVDAKKKAPNCVIKEATKKGADWSDPQILQFCTDTSLNYGQPSLSPDGTKMVFSMNGPNTRGGHDLYLSTYVKRGRTWSDPVNLGDNINTAGDEMYPYFFNDTTLYFSSDGWPGLGGLDLFVSYGQGVNWSKPKHLKAPLNSGGDDFGITFNDDKITGFFTSNRLKSKGDDIYSFTVPPQTYTISGVVFFNDSIGHKKRLITSADVTLTSLKDGRKFKAKTNKDGFYKFVLSDNTDYKIIAKKHGYFSSNVEHASTVGLDCSKDVNQDLEVKLPVITVHNIYYEVDSSRLLPASKSTLDSLYDHILSVYPYMVFEVGSHTDCRASYHHNDSLSLRRAQAVEEYLVSKGVDKNRLVPHGYGEHQLVNNCACEPNNVGPGKDCTEAEHAANRRTTFKILRTDFQNKEEKGKEEE